MDQAQAASIVADAVLIDRIRGGDVQAYGVLVQRYERTVLGSVLPIVRDMHAAQDVAQDVFVQCYQKLPTLRLTSRFGYWLLKAARRQAIRVSRQRQRAAATQMRAAEADLPSQSPLLDDEKEHLLDCVRRLPKHERLIVALRFFDGHSVKEIAAITQRPIGTVTKQLSRALTRLRDQLQVENESCPPQMNKSPAI
jgi:RNA polymerase sigma-70 factor (ECF subfamily)